MVKRIKMPSLRHNGHIVGFLPSSSPSQDIRPGSTRRPLWFLLFLSLFVSFVGFQILHTRLLLAHNGSTSSAATYSTEEYFTNPPPVGSTISAAAYSTVQYFTDPPSVSSTNRTTPRIKRAVLSRVLRRRDITRTLQKSRVENHAVVKDNIDDNKASSPTGCAPITIPVNDQKWGRQTHELLFRRDQIPGLNLQEQQGKQINNEKDEEKKERRFILKALTAFDGRLHMGYGDENLNTGPIPMHAYDPLLNGGGGEWVYLGTIPTEEIRSFRLGSNGQTLYTPELDGHGDDRRTTVGVYHLTCGSNAGWSMLGNPINQSAHNYELAVVQGRNKDDGQDRILVGTGARDNQPAFVMASDNAGKTWEEFFRLDPSDLTLPPNYTEHVILRVHTIGVTHHGQRIFVSARDKKTHLFFAYIYDQTNNTTLTTTTTTTAIATATPFQPITNLNITLRNDSDRPPYLIPVILQDEMILIARTYAPPMGHYLGSYRLVGTELVPADSVWPMVPNTIDGFVTRKRKLRRPGRSLRMTSVVYWTPDVDANRLLVLLQNEKTGVAGVYRLSSLQPNPDWEQALLLARLPENDRYVSMALLQNDLYLGTWRGQLYVVREFYQPLE